MSDISMQLNASQKHRKDQTDPCFSMNDSQNHHAEESCRIKKRYPVRFQVWDIMEKANSRDRNWPVVAGAVGRKEVAIKALETFWQVRELF